MSNWLGVTAESEACACVRVSIYSGAQRAPNECHVTAPQRAGTSYSHHHYLPVVQRGVTDAMRSSTSSSSWIQPWILTFFFFCCFFCCDVSEMHCSSAHENTADGYFHLGSYLHPVQCAARGGANRKTSFFWILSEILHRFRSGILKSFIYKTFPFFV